MTIPFGTLIKRIHVKGDMSVGDILSIDKKKVGVVTFVDDGDFTIFAFKDMPEGKLLVYDERTAV